MSKLELQYTCFHVLHFPKLLVAQEAHLSNQHPSGYNLQKETQILNPCEWTWAQYENKQVQKVLHVPINKTTDLEFLNCNHQSCMQGS